MAESAYAALMEGTTPSGTPATGIWWMYFKSDGLYMKDDTGTETKIVDPNTLGNNTLSLNAGGGYPSTTNGCAAPTKVEFTTNDVDLFVMDFDPSTAEYAQWVTTMPSVWDASTITFKVFWTAASGTAAQTCEWNLQALALNDDDAIDASWGSSVEVSDALIATGDMHVSATSSAVTVGGTPTAGGLVVFRVWRDATSDTLTGDARLVSVQISFGTA